jgi:hypothetical protein
MMYARQDLDSMNFQLAIGIFEDDPLLFKPGEFYSYSSYAVNLLQGVVEQASGLSPGVYESLRHNGGYNSCIVIYIEEALFVATTDNGERVGLEPLLELADIFRDAVDR